VIGCSYRGVATERQAVRNLIGCNMSFRREVFERAAFRSGIGRIGKLPVGCEETELCIRARQQRPDGDFVFEPAARVSHAIPRERARWTYFYRRCFAEGVSKARVAASTGRADALSAEREYVARTLPAGVARGVRDTLRGDAAGIVRAAFIVAGLACTAAGYLLGTLRGAGR
jgi:hypothetical protein